jgi:kynureninase
MSDHETGVDYARERDRSAWSLRDRFRVPDGHYMDGNSLGALPEPAEDAVGRVMEEWATLGIEAWTEGDPPWFHYGERLGDRLAPHVGADPEAVVAANSTTVNIHSLIGTFLDAAEHRSASSQNAGPSGDAADAPGVVVNELDFPTDHYAIRAQLRARGYDPEEHLHVVESRDGRTVEEADVEAVLESEDVGVLFMPSVLYRSGQLFDVERLAAAAHDAGAYAGFDIAHSVGVVDHDLGDSAVDFATWCSYKHLNAGPGAIAGLYVDPEHFGRWPGLPGWWGHEKESQFDLRTTYTPEQSAGAWQIGTVHVLSAAPLDGALDVFEAAGDVADADSAIDAVRERSLELTGYLQFLADEVLADHGYAVGTPREPSRRGGHVALEHEAAYRVSQALRDRGVVVDYRPPNVVRVCPAPLYVGFEDVHEVVEHCRQVVADGDYLDYGGEESGVT